MSATLQDVARVAGVHASTVSRVLSGKASIRSETRDRIFGLFVKSWGEKDSQPVKCGHGSWRNCESQRQRASEL